MVTNLLVVGPSESLHDSLAKELPRDRYHVWFSRPGAQVLGAVIGGRPEIVVIDAIDARPEAAQLEIALVKSVCSDARVIAVSRCSSGVDASVVEQGVFYYMAAPSEGELERAVESAAAAGCSKPSTL